jgi:hypothetical protein
VAHIGGELDEPGLVQRVVVLELHLQRLGDPAELEPEGAAACAAHQREGREHDPEHQWDRPEHPADDERKH